MAPIEYSKEGKMSAKDKFFKNVNFVLNEYRNIKDIKDVASVLPDLHSGFSASLKEAEKEILNDKNVTRLLNEARNAVEICKLSQTIKIPSDQLKILLECEYDPNSDHLTWLRLPFSAISIVPDPPYVFPAGADFQDSLKTRISIIIVAEILTPDGIEPANAKGIINPENVAKCFQAYMYFAQEQKGKWSIIRVIILVYKDNKIGLLHGQDVENSSAQTLAKWIVNIAYYLISPSVVIAKRCPDAKLVKASIKRGKIPPESWYEIEYKKTKYDNPHDDLQDVKWHVGHRFDVRGNFATFTKGSLKGRTIWRRPHQRGIKHSLYVPKVYNV